MSVSDKWQPSTRHSGIIEWDFITGQSSAQPDHQLPGLEDGATTGLTRVVRDGWPLLWPVEIGRLPDRRIMVHMHARGDRTALTCDCQALDRHVGRRDRRTREPLVMPNRRNPTERAQDRGPTPARRRTVAALKTSGFCFASCQRGAAVEHDRGDNEMSHRLITAPGPASALTLASP